MDSYRIPFNRACFVGNEVRYITEAVERGHISGDGPATEACQRLLEESMGVPKVLLTTSCTHALELAAILLDLGPGDEVIIPSFTFVSTANAFVLRGAAPVFIDVRPDTLNLDERLLEDHITPRTRAVVPVHYAGVGAEMDIIIDVAARHGLAVVEDNAHGLFGRYRGHYLGTMGSLATQSFHETKNFTCGEGGALLVNDERYVDRAEIVREKGTNRKRFFRGLVDKYSWVDIGSSYLPSDMLAAVLLAQLEGRSHIETSRRTVWNYYHQHLASWAAATGVTLPTIPGHCDSSYHMYQVLLPSQEHRAAMIGHLRARGILAVFHYQPLHLSEMGRRFGGAAGQCPVTEDVADRLLRLPLYNDLTEPELAYVVEAVTECRW